MKHWHPGQPIPGKNSPQLWVDKSRCPAGRGCRAIARMGPNPKAKKYMREVKNQAKLALATQQIMEGLIEVKGDIVVGDLRRRDLTNMLESIFDALEEVVFVNDHQVHHLDIWMVLDRDEPRFELEFNDITGHPKLLNWKKAGKPKP